MKSKLLFFLLLVFSLPALAKTFPICMYAVNNPKDIPLLKQAGFNCIQTYSKQPEKLADLAKMARQNNMQVVFYPNELFNTPYQQAAQSWPILAWYLVDEPDVARWSRAKTIAKRNETQKAFPQQENALVIGQGRTLIDYYDIPDNLMVDWYPVPHLPLTSLGDNVAWAKQGQISSGKTENPLWAVVQAFDWKEYKQHRPDNERIGRFPTKEEIRFMSYDAILNGATGLFYFAFITNGKTLPDAQPQWWKRVTSVSEELAELRPVLENGTLTANILPFAEPLVAQTRIYKKYTYTILLNRSDREIPVPAQLTKSKYKLLFGQEKTSVIQPYEVWIIKKRK
jgi:hypothetical protein